MRRASLIWNIHFKSVIIFPLFTPHVRQASIPNETDWKYFSLKYISGFYFHFRFNQYTIVWRTDIYANISRLSTHVTTGIHFEQNLLWISEILNNLFVISGRPKIRSNWKRSQFATNTFYVRLCLRYTVHLNASSIQWKYYTHRENSIFIINNIYLHLQYKNRKTYSNSKCSRSLNLRQTKEEENWIHKRIFM